MNNLPPTTLPCICYFHPLLKTKDYGAPTMLKMFTAFRELLDFHLLNIEEQRKVMELISTEKLVTRVVSSLLFCKYGGKNS